MKKRFFLFVLIVLTVITVSCTTEDMSGSGNVISGNASGQSDSQGSEQEPVRTDVFTVNSAGKQVVFSPGALYWDGSSFKMEENQYDYRTWYNKPSVINGVYTANNTAIPEGETGLFYWSKDVEKTYATSYGDNEKTTSDIFAFANGGKGAITGWDVLSADEWTYLIGFDSEADARQDAASKYGLATITTGQGATVEGLVLLPDSWTLPTGCDWAAGCERGWTANEYDATHWASMEQAGAVFLPAVGDRDGSSVSSAGNGSWWSSTPNSEGTYNSFSLQFNLNNVNVTYRKRGSGQGVRLVAPVRN